MHPDMRTCLEEIERELIEYAIPEAQAKLVGEERLLHELMPDGQRFITERQAWYVNNARKGLIFERRRLLACRWLLRTPWRRLRLEYDKNLGRDRENIKPSFVEIISNGILRCEPALSNPFEAGADSVLMLVDIIALECTPHVEE